MATGLSGKRSAGFIFIFVTILLDMLALGMVMPILPKLVEQFLGGNTADASRIFGLFGTAWALMQFVVSPLMGALSDRFGRRPIVLMSNFGLGLDYILMAVAPSLSWLFVGRVISGMTAASISTSFAYIADVTEPDRRAAAFGRMGAAFGAGFVLGPAIGGLLGGIDPRLPFWVAAGLSLANFAYGYLVLPESLAPERRSRFSWARANPVGAWRLLKSNKRLSGLAIVNFLAQLAHVVLPSTFVLYAGYRYGWDTIAVGLALAGFGVFAAIVQGGLTGPVVRTVGERAALLIGLGGGALGMIISGLATTGAIFVLAIPVMAAWGISGAAAQGLMTRVVGPGEQGQLQGANNSVQALAQLAGPSVFTLTFAYFIGKDAPFDLVGAPFLLAAILLAASMAIALIVTRDPPVTPADGTV